MQFNDTSYTQPIFSLANLIIKMQSRLHFPMQFLFAAFFFSQTSASKKQRYANRHCFGGPSFGGYLVLFSALFCVVYHFLVSIRAVRYDGHKGKQLPFVCSTAPYTWVFFSNVYFLVLLLLPLSSIVF